MIVFHSEQAFLHRIRQTAEDQQCLSPEHVKVGPNLWATWDTSHYRKHLQSLWNCTMQHFYSLTPDFTPHLHPFLSPFLVLFSSSILLSSSPLSFLPSSACYCLCVSPLSRFCFQILRTSWSCTKRCCLPWRPTFSLSLIPSTLWDTCSFSL